MGMGHTWMGVASRDVTVKFRLDRSLASRLARLARKKGATRSAVLREAIGLAERDMEREEAQRILVAQAEEDQGRLRGRRPRPAKFGLR